jgi:hypothetical protein
LERLRGAPTALDDKVQEEPAPPFIK